jgi:putative endonuclease
MVVQQTLNLLILVRIQVPQPSFAKASDWQVGMYYTYILLSSKSHRFYIGSTKDLKERLSLHNTGKVKSTKSGERWKLVWYCAFETDKQARDFEKYLKSGSGKSFAYKRLVSEALTKDFLGGRIPRYSEALA